MASKAPDPIAAGGVGSLTAMVQYSIIRIQTTGTQQLIVIFLGILVMIMLGGVLYLMSGVPLPFMVALFLAYLLDLLVRLLRYCRVPLALAVCFALLVTFVFLALMGMLFYASAQSFVREFPTYEPELRALFTTLTSRVEVAPELSWQLSDLSKEFSSASVVRAVLASVGTFVTFLGHLLLVLLFMVFILLGQQRLPQRIHRAFGEEQAQRLTRVLQRITRDVQTSFGDQGPPQRGHRGAGEPVPTDLASRLCRALGGAGVHAQLHSTHRGASRHHPATPGGHLEVRYAHASSLGGDLRDHHPHCAQNTSIEPRLMGRNLHLSPLLVVLSLLFSGVVVGNRWDAPRCPDHGDHQNCL